MLTRHHRKKPLSRKIIVLTRPRRQSSELANLLKRLGASVRLFPTIRIRPPRNARPLERAISRLSEYDLLIFTSPNGVRSFYRRLNGTVPRRIRIAAIGPKTALAVRCYGGSVSVIPDEFRAEALARRLTQVRGRRVLIPRAWKAREALPDILRKKGANVDVVEAYRTLPETALSLRLKALLLRGGADAVTFTSSSTAESFSRLFARSQLKKIFRRCLAVSIGPITSRTLKRLGIRRILQADPYTSRGIAKALARYYGAQPNGKWF